MSEEHSQLMWISSRNGFVNKVTTIPRLFNETSEDASVCQGIDCTRYVSSNNCMVSQCLGIVLSTTKKNSYVSAHGDATYVNDFSLLPRSFLAMITWWPHTMSKRKASHSDRNMIYKCLTSWHHLQSHINDTARNDNASCRVVSRAEDSVITTRLLIAGSMGKGIGIVDQHGRLIITTTCMWTKCCRAPTNTIRHNQTWWFVRHNRATHHVRLSKSCNDHDTRVSNRLEAFECSWWLESNELKPRCYSRTRCMYVLGGTSRHSQQRIHHVRSKRQALLWRLRG